MLLQSVPLHSHGPANRTGVYDHYGILIFVFLNNTCREFPVYIRV